MNFSHEVAFVLIDNPEFSPCVIPGCRHWGKSICCPLHGSLLPDWIVEQWAVVSLNEQQLSEDDQNDDLVAITVAIGQDLAARQNACTAESLQPIVPRSRRPLPPMCV